MSGATIDVDRTIHSRTLSLRPSSLAVITKGAQDRRSVKHEAQGTTRCRERGLVPSMDSEDGSRLFVGGYEPYSESQPGPRYGFGTRFIAHVPPYPRSRRRAAVALRSRFKVPAGEGYSHFTTCGAAGRHYPARLWRRRVRM